MNVSKEIAEARAAALSLRATAQARSPEQGPLKFRLTRAAEALNGMVMLAVRGLDRVEELEQQLAVARAAGGGKPVVRAALGNQSETSPSRSALMAQAPLAPVIVGGVDVAPLALAARILHMVELEANASGASLDSELAALLQAARRIVEEVFTDLQAASAKVTS